MIPQPPPGQGPIDPRGVFSPPVTPDGTESPAGAAANPSNLPNVPNSPLINPVAASWAPPPAGGPPPPMGWTPPGPWGSPPGFPPAGPPVPQPQPQPGPAARPPGPVGPPANNRPPQKSGAGRVILLTVLLILLGLSGLLNLVLFTVVGLSGSSGDRIIASTVKSGDRAEEIAIVPLTGEIDDGAARRIDRFLNRLTEDKQVKAVVIEIDSPGGTVTAADEIYKRIQRFKTERAEHGLSNQVVVSMKSMATSGGYYAACAGDYIFAEPTTMTGNIGVLMPSYNFSGLMQKYGVEETTIVSTGSKYKNAGSPFRPQSDQDKQYLQALADNAFDQFKKVVNDGRGSKLVAKKEDLFSGRVFAGQEAKDAGLVDQIGYPSDAYQFAAKQANLSKPNIVRYEEPTPSLLGLLAHGQVPAPTAAGPSGQSGTLNVNGVDVRAGPESLDGFRTHRLLYR